MSPPVPTIPPIRGMNDVLPTQIATWQWLEATARELLAGYGYEEIRVPVVEQTQLFKRAIGEYTDVVEKEMYSFVDQGGENLTLRPEATAGIVRAAISNGMLRGARHKLWCTGPMFRHERPQKGRFRQFHQVDVEAIGFAGPGHRRRADRADSAALEAPRPHARQPADQFPRHRASRAARIASCW